MLLKSTQSWLRYISKQELPDHLLLSPCTAGDAGVKESLASQLSAATLKLEEFENTSGQVYRNLEETTKAKESITAENARQVGNEIRNLSFSMRALPTKHQVCCMIIFRHNR